MFKLLRSDLTRLLKSKYLWVCVAVQIFLTALIILINSGEQGFTSDAMAVNIFCMGGIAVPSIMLAIISSLFIGSDYQYGTIRNKIVTGGARFKIYLSNLITVCVALILLLLSAMLVSFALGMPLLGGFKCGGTQIFKLFICGIFACLSYAAIITAVNMTMKNMTASAITLLVALIATMLLMQYFYLEVSAPEFYKSYEINQFGETIMVEIPNPNKCAPWLAALYKFILTVFPTGQLNLISYGNFILADGPGVPAWQMLLSSVLIGAASTALGLAVFQRENLK